MNLFQLRLNNHICCLLPFLGILYFLHNFLPENSYFSDTFSINLEHT